MQQREQGARAVQQDDVAAVLDDVSGEIDARLRAEIRERRRHRGRIALLAPGDGLALPPGVAAYLGRLRALGVDERIVRVERDGWVPLADGLAASLTRMADERGDAYLDDLDDADVGPALVAQMDTLAFDAVPPARRLAGLLAERGWSGWTRLRRVAAGSGCGNGGGQAGAQGGGVGG
ncbi:hypothetical protein ACL02R_01620 [Streptomyces sp. MS19]|uniref:hypothetical protein n=1 Tax=Streptomyces sp. MS19 TaxID=3385972 RepID=UPI0039A3E96C